MSGIISDNTERGVSGLVKTPSTGAPSTGSSDPTNTTNTNAVGDRIINTTSGELFVCTSATTDQNTWEGQLGTSVNYLSFLGNRGLWAGGETPSETAVIDYIAIDTTGNAADFGDLSANREGGAAVSNKTRFVGAGGYTTPAITDIIEYVNFASLGDATDFGDRTYALYHGSQGASNGTRGIFGGGSDQKGLDYITIASTGNAADFGDFNVMENNAGAVSNGTRAVWAGGDN